MPTKAKGIYKSSIGITSESKRIMSLLSSLNDGFLQAHINAISNINMAKINRLIELFRQSRNAVARLKEADRIAKAYKMAGMRNSRFKNVSEAYDYILEREQQKSAYRSRLSEFQPQSWMKRYTDVYGKDASKIADLEYEDAMRSITDPGKQERINLERRWGKDKGGKLFEAQADEKLRYYKMNDYERILHNLTEMYGGDKDKAEQAYSDILKNELPSFFKDSKLNSKTLYSIKEGLSQKFPFLGAITKNPLFIVLELVTGILNKFLERSDAANKSVVSWQNASLLYGKPSAKFFEAALMAGETDPVSISKRLGKFAMKYGTMANAELVYLSFAKQVAENKNPENIKHIAAGYKFDETDVAIALHMANMLPKSEQRIAAARTAAQNIKKEYGYSTGSNLIDTFDAFFYDTRILGKLEARDLPLFGLTGALLGGSIPGMDNISNAQKVSDIATQDLEYQKDTTPSSSKEIQRQSSNRSVMFAIGNVNVNADNADEFVDSMKSEAKSRGGMGVIESFDPKGF